MKQPVSKDATGRLPDQVRNRVLELRRGHSLSQVARLTGLPLGTVKTLCSRSGAFRDNLQHRAMFTLPPIRESAGTDLAALDDLPPQEAVTGDKEIDALLWLRSVIKTGQAAHIEKAMRAAERIKTPLADLEKRYTQHLAAKHPGSFGAVFASMGFADLKRLAERSVEKRAKQQEASSRFGDDLFADTPAEQFCADALDGLKRDSTWAFDKVEVDTRFAECADLLPHTLADCLHELRYWSDLYWLRNSSCDCGDPVPEASARDDFVFRCLARIRARSKDEAIAVFRYLAKSDRQDWDESNAILLNLLAARG